MKPDELRVLVILVAASIVPAVVAHSITRNFLRAVVWTSAAVCLGVQAYLATQGYNWHKDKFALVVLLYPAGVAFGVAMAVGIVFDLVRQRIARRRSPTDVGCRNGSE